MRALLVLVFALLLPSAVESAIADEVERVMPAVVALMGDDGGHCAAVAYTPRRLVTAAHCSKEGVGQRALLQNGRSYAVRLLGIAGGPSGVAVVELEPAAPSLPFIQLNARRLRPGESVVVIGHPYGHGWTVTQGVVSFIDRNLPEDGEMLQLSAGVVPGNSGGPVFTADGQWVGIVDSVFQRTLQVQPLGLAFPVPVPHLAFALPAGRALLAIKEIEARR